MKKSIFCFFICCLWVFPAWSEEAENTPNTEEVQAESSVENSNDLVRYVGYGKMPEIKELDESEDDLYSGAEVKPMDIKISQDEKQQDPSTDLDYIDKEFVLPELSCNNEKLTKQVALFIQDHLENDEVSVKGRRNHILMVKNLHNFEEISESDLGKGNFNVRAALAHLRINENREIYKICESKNNTYGKYNNVYLILYPYTKYYKVVVTDLIVTPEKIEDASFIYNW